MQLSSDQYETEVARQAVDNSFYKRNLFIFTAGLVLFLLGGFMVLEIYAWHIFDIWLPLLFLLSGLMLLSSSTYPAWLGGVLITISFLAWLHSYGLDNFAGVTHAVDWTLFLLGGAIMLFAVLKSGAEKVSRSK